MDLAFSPSVNIIRDQQKDFQYLVTPNAKRIVGQLEEDFEKGLRSFTLIGSYGTGKSSFLLALEQTLSGIKAHFNAPLLSETNNKIVKIVGSYGSIIQAFADELDVKSGKHQVENILSELYNQYHQLGKKDPLLVLVVDELGKFLEYAAKNQPEKELYFLQQLAEFANNPANQIVLLTTVHQGFDAYAYELSKTLRQEWTKVKGRFKEVTFNEPVEQLLYLAAEHIFHATKQTTKAKSIKEALCLFEYSKSFKADYSKQIATQIYPLDVLSANVLTLALQRYGQNERSLFSFLESTDLASIGKFKNTEQTPFYSLTQVFDYLTNNFFSFLHSKYNSDSASWASIKVAIEQVENSFDEDVNDYLKVVKAIGLLNMFANAGAVLDEYFLVNYAQLCLGISEPGSILQALTDKNIIRFRKHSKRYVLTEEAEIDIERALIEANNTVSEITDVPTVLKKYFDFAPVLAKEYSYINGTARYFDFVITEYPKILEPTGEIDGYIQLVFSEKAKRKNEPVDEDPSANIYVYYNNSKAIKELLFDLEKTQKVLAENRHDKVARRELESIRVHQTHLLNHYILNNLYTGSSDVTWRWGGQAETTINSKKQFNKLLTTVCKRVYQDAPTFRNELVNKHKISSAVSTARRNYFNGLVNSWDKPDLGIALNKFPPEKMIYKSLLQDNGLAPFKDEFEEIKSLTERSTFYPLWQTSLSFLKSTKGNKKTVKDFTELLSARPFKLKQGFIDFWVPTFLFLKRDDFALYVDNAFVPAITVDTLDLMVKKPKDFEIKAFDIEGVRLDIFNSYRVFLNQETKPSFGNSSFIETVKPFLVFYKTLPDYAKQTQRLSRSALAVREAIAKSKDPEVTFFESFPTALGTSVKELNENSTSLANYTATLQSAIREIRTCFDGLIERFEAFIKQGVLFEEHDLSFEATKQKLQKRYTNLKRHLLLPKQRTFVQRVDSLLDDKKAWLNSLAQVLIGKTLEHIRDEEEALVHESFKQMVQEIDSLTELSEVTIDEAREQVYNIQFATFGSAPLKSIVRVSNEQAERLPEYTQRLERMLSNDPEMNKLILTTLLQKLLSNGEG